MGAPRWAFFRRRNAPRALSERCSALAARRNAAAARLALGLVLELMTLGAFRVSDELWEVLAPLIPKQVNTHPLGGGRPRVPDRTCADGICYVLRTGCQWKALDATGICSGSTAHLRFQEWVAAGVFLELWRVGLERFDELPGLGWSWLSLDGANRHDMKLVRATLDSVPMPRADAGSGDSPGHVPGPGLRLWRGSPPPTGFTAHIRKGAAIKRAAGLTEGRRGWFPTVG